MPDPTSRPWLTATEVADRLAVTTSTLADWRKAHTGPKAVALGVRQHVRYHVEDLLAWEQERRA